MSEFSTTDQEFFAMMQADAQQPPMPEATGRLTEAQIDAQVAAFAQELLGLDQPDTAGFNSSLTSEDEAWLDSLGITTRDLTAEELAQVHHNETVAREMAGIALAAQNFNFHLFMEDKKREEEDSDDSTLTSVGR